MKKKRIVKLEPQTVELFAEVLSKLRPPPPLTVSQWADRYRVLSAESSAEPGRWHTEKAPYQRAIMDAIGDPHVRSVVVMSAAQIGKTDAFILNPLGYYMDYAPCPVMCMQPTLDMGQTLSKDRIAPMIRDTPRLTGLVDTKSRYAGNTVMKKNFPGGHITIVGANSPSSLASRPIKVLLADEIDRYPKSAGTEGDPLDLAKKRQTTFWDYKTVMVSTPTIKGDSRIEDAYDHWYYNNTYGVRPAFVLPSTLVVSDDGTVSTNTAPAINASSTNLGKQNAPFNFGYTVTDADGDTLTVTEKLDRHPHRRCKRYCTDLRAGQYRRRLPAHPQRKPHHPDHGQRRQGKYQSERYVH